MRSTRTFLFLLTLLPALSWAQPVLLPGIRRPTTTNTTILSREDSTGFLIQTSKLGAPERVGVDYQNVRGLPGQFSQFRTQSNTLYPVTARSMATVRAAAAQSVPFVVSSDPISGGTFYYDPLDSTTPDDGALTIVAPNGWRYKRQVLDKRVTPQMFGAKGDGTTDDALALIAWINYTGTGSLYAPAGDYKSTAALTRLDKGVCVLSAASGKTSFSFPNDTDGLTIANSAASPTLGNVTVRDFEIRSTGPKSNGRVALRITSQYFRPGPSVENISIAAPAALANEWSIGLNYVDCLGTSTRNFYCQGLAVDGRTVGIQFSNRAGFPCYEHTLFNLNIRGTLGGVYALGATTGGFGVEGIQFTDCNFVAVGNSIKAISYAGSPYIGMRGVHINNYNGYAILISGYSQLFFNDVVVYANVNSGSPTPDAAVRLHNVLGVDGSVFVNTTTNIPAAVKLTGSGGEIASLRAIAEVAAATTTGIAVGAGYQGSEVKVKRNWTGNTTWGTTQAQPIIDSSGTAVTPLLTAVEPLPQDKSILAYSRSDYRPHFVYSDQLPQYRYQYVGASATVDPTLGTYVAVGNGSANITVTIDVSKMVLGQTITIKRYDQTSTGTVSLQTQDPNRKVQDGAGNLNTVTALATTAGQRQMNFMYNGTHLEFIGY